MCYNIITETGKNPKTKKEKEVITMKKFDLRNIMTNAWALAKEFVKAYGWTLRKALSSALKQAWADAKKAAEKEEEKPLDRKGCINRLRAIIAHSATRYTFFEDVRDWENYGKSRTYLKIVEKCTDRTSRHYKVREYGYFDNIAGVYVPGRNDLTRNFDFGGASF